MCSHKTAEGTLKGNRSNDTGLLLCILMYNKPVELATGEDRGNTGVQETFEQKYKEKRYVAGEQHNS